MYPWNMSFISKLEGRNLKLDSYAIMAIHLSLGINYEVNLHLKIFLFQPLVAKNYMRCIIFSKCLLPFPQESKQEINNSRAPNVLTLTNDNQAKQPTRIHSFSEEKRKLNIYPDTIRTLLYSLEITSEHYVPNPSQLWQNQLGIKFKKTNLPWTAKEAGWRQISPPMLKLFPQIV